MSKFTDAVATAGTKISSAYVWCQLHPIASSSMASFAFGVLLGALYFH